MQEQERPQEHEHEHYGLLPADGVVELTDKLTGYMYEIEHGGFSDVMGQVLDDFLDQSGGMPDDLKDSEAFEQISRGQLAVTLAYNLGRLEGRSPQVVNALVEQALQAFGLLPVDESADITDEDFGDPKVQVYPRMRRLRYQAPQILQVQRRDDSPDAGGSGDDGGGDQP